jgi:hypothetical protein
MDAIRMFKLSGQETKLEAAVGPQSMGDFVPTGRDLGLNRGLNCTRQATGCSGQCVPPVVRDVKRNG